METLDKILEKIDSLEAKVNKTKEAKDKSSIWGWVIAIVVGAAVSIGAALLLRKINKKNEELAKLRTKAEKQELQAKNMEHSAKVAKKEAKQRQLQNKADTLKAQADHAQGRLREEEAKLDEAIARIMRVKTWKELDLLNQRLR